MAEQAVGEETRTNGAFVYREGGALGRLVERWLSTGLRQSVVYHVGRGAARAAMHGAAGVVVAASAQSLYSALVHLPARRAG